MELCTARGISELSSLQPNRFAQNRITLNTVILPGRQICFLRNRRCFNSELKCTPEDASVVTRDTTYTTNDGYSGFEPKSDSSVRLEDDQSTDGKEDLPVDSSQFLNFLDNFNIKLDDNSTYPILVLGGGSAVALWLIAGLLGAIDSIPLIPKVLQLVGLGYSIWFTSRYLIFKKNRDELFGEVEQIKQKVLGLEEDNTIN